MPTTAAAGPVTFVGHDASATGAPRVLLSLLGWARRAAPGAASTVLLRGGPLVEEYARRSPTRLLGRRVAATDAVATAARLVGVEGDLAARSLRRLAAASLRRTPVVVANTLAAAPFAVAAVGGDQRLVVHVHELDGVAARVLPPGPTRRRVVARADRFVATGPAVATMLVGRWGVPASRVEVVPAFVDPPSPTPAAVGTARRAMTGPDAPAGGADGGRLLAVAAGMAGPRKGADRFVDLVATAVGSGVDLRAAWVGADPASSVAAEMEVDVATAGLAGRVRVLPPVDDAVPHLAAADVHVSVAREDPFPLTLLEAGAVGTPVAATDAGGAGALLRAAGTPDVVVPVHDLVALSEVLGRLEADDGLRAERAAALRDHVRSHHLTAVVAPLLWDACTRWP